MVEYTQKERYTIADLLEVAALLRGPGGCPWDQEQTHASMRMALVEETYEVLEAIDQNDAELLQEELGDVLWQVVMHAQLEAEEGRFSFDDVCDGVCKKLVYRHPHVFGQVEVENTAEVLTNWNLLKNKEKGRDTLSAELESVPACLPALMYSRKVQKRAGDHGFGLGKDTAQAVAQLRAAADALEQAGPGEAAEIALGDALFAAVAAGRGLDVDAEQALQRATRRFAVRVERCEQAAEQEIETLSAQEKRSLWEANQ